MHLFGQVLPGSVRQRSCEFRLFAWRPEEGSAYAAVTGTAVVLPSGRPLYGLSLGDVGKQG